MEALKKFKTSTYAVSIIYIIVGLIMLLNPSFISDAVNYVIGVLVIIGSVVSALFIRALAEIINLLQDINDKLEKW